MVENSENSSADYLNSQQIKEKFEVSIEKPSKTAIWSFILGLMTFICCGHFIAGIPAIIMGAMELNDIKKGKTSEKGKVYAILGIVFGGVGILLIIIVYLIYGLAIFSQLSKYKN